MKKKKYILLIMLACVLSMPVAHAKTPVFITKHLKSTEIKEKQINIIAPPIAEHGDVVPVSIQQVMLGKNADHVKEIWLFNGDTKNQIAHYKLTPSSTAAGLATRIKMRNSGTLYAVARLSDGHLVSGQTNVKVTIGGCGGGGFEDTKTDKRH